MAMVANLFSLLIGAASVLVYPKFISLGDYGYYQLFLFFTFYTVLLSFGISEGTFLVQGGKEYSRLDFLVLHSQFFWLNIVEFIAFSVLAVFCIAVLQADGDHEVVYILVCCCGLIINSRYYLINLAQATNRIRDYSISVIIERAVAFLGGIASIVLGFGSFFALIIFDIAGRITSLVFLIVRMPEVALGKRLGLRDTLRRSRKTVLAGSRLMVAAYVSSLLVAVTRYCVENHWDIVIFAKVSLIIALANMITRCVASAGQAIYPIMKTESEADQVEVYQILSRLIDVLSISLFVLFPLIAFLLTSWLPDYEDALVLAAILLPIGLFESKNSLLITTYYKIFRLERLLLRINIVSLCACTALIIYTVYIADSIAATLLMLTLILGLRCVISEGMLSRVIDIKVRRSCILELIVCAAFILVNYCYAEPASIMSFTLLGLLLVGMGVKRLRTSLASR